MQKKVYIKIFLMYLLVISICSSMIQFTINVNEQSTKELTETPQLSWEIAWNDNGNLVCGETSDQENIQVCSDGAGGAIITWDQYSVTSSTDVYVQHINSTGDLKWDVNGILLCSDNLAQQEPQICSDGAGGAIITWEDKRSGTNFDIYAQRINSNGVLQWTANGVEICTEGTGQDQPQICSDGAGGAIIVWKDNRLDHDIHAQRINSNGDVQWTIDGVSINSDVLTNSNPMISTDGAGGAIIAWDTHIGGDNYDVFAQRVDSNGVKQWGANGKTICSADHQQNEIRIVNNEVGGAIFTWQDERTDVEYDVYAQRVSSGGTQEWAIDGIPICIASDSNYHPEISGDGAGGAIIVWQDIRSGVDFDIYAQRVNSNGVIQWATNGMVVCNATLHQEGQQICSDGAEGALITWHDDRGIVGEDIYAQRINSNGITKWTYNGIAITNITGIQVSPSIINTDSDNAIIIWSDDRSGDENIYAQKIENSPPSSNHPADIATFTDGLETINWVLYDDCGGGKYRVSATDVNGSYYNVIDWTAWTPSSSINVPINRDYLGTFNYILEFYDDQNRNGTSDIVIVQVVRENFPPISTHPEDINTTTDGTETINWTLSDDAGGGMYRVLANNTLGNYYAVVDWTAWTNNTLIQVPINRTDEGVFNYTIEFYDDENLYGIPDTVIVIVTKRGFRISGYNVLILIIPSLAIIYAVSRKLKRNLKNLKRA